MTVVSKFSITCTIMRMMKNTCNILHRFTDKLFLKCSAWLESTDDDVIAKVNRRIGAVTGLDMSTAEPLQVQRAQNRF